MPARPPSQGDHMRSLLVLLVVLGGGGCAALPPATIQEAPGNQAQAVVFDIDGTLTPHPLSISKVRPDAASAVNVFAKKGYRIIYLSARVGWLQGGIPDWLEKNKFPMGSLFLPQTKADHQYPDVFKRRVLEDLAKHGWQVKYAYGDSHTDFVAYELARIPHFFGLIRRGASSCQPERWQACLEGGWTGHLKFLRDERSVPTVPAN